MTIDQQVLRAVSESVQPTYLIANRADLRGQTAKVRRVLQRLQRDGEVVRAKYRFWPHFGWKLPPRKRSIAAGDAA